jgi:hypothetical protein
MVVIEASFTVVRGYSLNCGVDVDVTLLLVL